MKKQLTLKTCVASIWNEYKVFCRTHVFCEQYHAMSSNSKLHVHKSKWLNWTSRKLQSSFKLVGFTKYQGT